MKFRNVSDDTLDVPSLGVSVEPGGMTPELDKKQAAGFAGQTEVWAAVGGDVKDAGKSPASTKAKE